MARRRYIATADPNFGSTDALLICRVDPGFPVGNDAGLRNDMTVVDDLLLSQPAIFYQCYAITPVERYLFARVRWGRPRNSAVSRETTWDTEANPNVNFDSWSRPTRPDYWAVSNVDAQNYIAKDYVTGSPIAARLVSEDGSAFNVTLRFPGLTPRYAQLPPFTIAPRDYTYTIVIDDPSETPIYVRVEGIGDLNGGDPINPAAATIQESFQFPVTETQRSFDLQLRPDGVPGSAAIQSASLIEEVEQHLVSRPEWSYDASPSTAVDNVPIAYPRRENSTSYQVGDITQWGWQYYACSSAGTSGAIIPDWDDGLGSVSDGGVTWSPQGAYHGECLMCNPPLVDVYGSGTAVVQTPPGGGPDVWTVVGGSFDDGSVGDQMFVEQPPPIRYEAVSDTTTTALQKTVPISSVPTDAVDNTWHTFLAIIQWPSFPPGQAVIEVRVDFNVVLRGFIPPGGGPMTGEISDPSAIAEAFIAGDPYPLGNSTFAYWFSYRYADGAFPSGSTFTDIRYYPAGKTTPNAGDRSIPVVLQDALGVKGPYWPASIPYALEGAFHPGDRLRLRLSAEGRPSSTPINPRRGTLFLMASPIRNETPGQVISPPADEILVGLGNDCLFGIDTQNHIYAAQGTSQQYRSQSQSPISDYPPDYYVVTWDADQNRMVIYYAWSRTGQAARYEIGTESGLVRFGGDGDYLELSTRIYRTWQIHHAAVFDRALDAETIADMLPP